MPKRGRRIAKRKVRFSTAVNQSNTTTLATTGTGASQHQRGASATPEPSIHLHACQFTTASLVFVFNSQKDSAIAKWLLMGWKLLSVDMYDSSDCLQGPEVQYPTTSEEHNTGHVTIPGTCGTVKAGIGGVLLDDPDYREYSDGLPLGNGDPRNLGPSDIITSEIELSRAQKYLGSFSSRVETRLQLFDLPRGEREEIDTSELQNQVPGMEWQRIRELRINIWKLRSQVHEIRAKLRAKQNAKYIADDAFMKHLKEGIRLETSLPHTSLPPDRATMDGLYEKILDTRKDYNLFKHAYDRHEELLNEQEEELERAEERAYSKSRKKVLQPTTFGRGAQHLPSHRRARGKAVGEQTYEELNLLDSLSKRGPLQLLLHHTEIDALAVRFEDAQVLLKAIRGDRPLVLIPFTKKGPNTQEINLSFVPIPPSKHLSINMLRNSTITVPTITVKLLSSMI
ncbi:hypothetical protein G7Y89_g11434 [Cudoniella acicularis]|uniref:Uncharacterized protein n=1 Tax=Cudoniella acicularis TaxID=354080 RepID=A0A8H4RD87_9HELO|nr:hypothetical protein G7Y89_g11434 [Cudoniella acicularis]